VLSEFASSVAAFEREEPLLVAARALQPGVAWTAVDDLAKLPSENGSFDFVMTFTVLQHVPESEAQRILRELRRIAAGGFVLLAEETDPGLGAEPPPGWSGGLTVGRPIATWESWMAPWRLVLNFPRTIEPGYARADVGTYMLFRDERSRIEDRGLRIE